MIGETVFQSIDATLGFSSVVLTVGLIVLCVIASRANRMLNNARLIESHLNALQRYAEDEQERRTLPRAATAAKSAPPATGTFQVKRGETIVGQFRETEFREKIFSNQIEPDDFYRTDDVTNWTPVSTCRVSPS